MAANARLESQAGPGGERNAGWREARAPIVAFTDDDCEPTPQWLARTLAACRAYPDAVTQGITLPHPSEAPARAASPARWTSASWDPGSRPATSSYPRDS